MQVALTKEAKDWLAINAGIGNCFSPTGVSYVIWNNTIPAFETHVGSTGDVVNAFMISHMAHRDTDAIIASTNYTQFKAINGGTDIGFDDTDFAYTNDGTTSGTSAYCYVPSPANVISATLTVDKTDCTEPCTVGGTVSWTNNGGSPSAPIDLKVTVNEGTPKDVAIGAVIPANTTTDTYSFSLPDLAAGTYTICASPDSGTTCKVVTVKTPADIVATAITPAVTTCVAPCGTTVVITWRNNGQTAGNFTPTITVNGTATSVASESLAGLTSVTKTFTLTGLLAGTISICSIPNTFPCATITVTAPVSSASFTSVPTGAMVYIDGGDTSSGVTGETPVVVQNLSVGLHHYRLVTAECYSDATGEFTTVANTETPVSVTFDTAASFASVPDGARIWIDGVDKGVDTPHDITGLAAGEHTYILKKHGYADAMGGFTTTLCQRVDIPSVNLSQVAEAGFAPILIGGLAIGALIMGSTPQGITLIPGPRKVSRSNISNN